MASPQKENGHTSIANEILEQIVATPLPAREIQMLFFIIRKTYGYQKKGDRISLSQFEKALKISRPQVSKYLKNLIARGMVVRTPLLVISFEKDYEKWIVATPLLVGNKKNPSSYAPTKTSSPAPTHKRKKEITKEINQATANAVGDINPIFSLFEKTINPTINYGNTSQRKALETLIQKVGLEKTINAVKYAISIQTDRYAPTITTPIQLLNKYGELQAYYARHQKAPKESKHLSL